MTHPPLLARLQVRSIRKNHHSHLHLRAFVSLSTAVARALLKDSRRVGGHGSLLRRGLRRGARIFLIESSIPFQALGGSARSQTAPFETCLTSLPCLARCFLSLDFSKKV
jgi:hypothetical protein